MIKGNKGEWSEFYVLLRLIESRKLYLADDNLEIDKNITVQVNKIKHFEEGAADPVEYTPLSGEESVLVREDSKGIKSFIVDKTKLKKHISDFFTEVAQKNKKGAFSVDTAAPCMEEIGCVTIKAGSMKKADIILDIDDRGQERKDVGYSIKSVIGGAATLFNTSAQSEIKYNVNSFAGDVEMINCIEGSRKYQKRMKKIIECGGAVTFDSVSPVFLDNLNFIDSNFSEMLASMIKKYYLGENRGGKMREAVKLYAEETDTRIELVESRVKQFLLNSALGMTPGKPWDGRIKAEGGYLVVKENGDIACYQTYSMEKFKDYLYNHTKIDTPSGTRHDFAKLIYGKEGQKVALNFQIRFDDKKKTKTLLL